MCSTVFVVDDQISSNLTKEQVAILGVKSGMYFGLDGVGVRIWDMIQKPILVKDIANTIQSEYEVEPGRCEQDTIALLEGLLSRELINVL